MCARRGVGRTGGVEEARELVALVATLSDEGATLDAETIATRLGTTLDEARKLLSLILTASTSDGDYLSLMENDDGSQVSLAFAEGMHGKRLRLTSGEMLAISAALDRLGVPADDSARTAITRSLSSAGLDEATLRRMLAQLPTKNDSMVLKTCAKARCDHRDLVFAYRHVGEVSRGERCVAPLAVRLEDDVWYLDGFDRVRGGRRTFRIDHMSDARVVTSAGGVSEERNEPSRKVRITFRDEHYLTLLHWKHLEIISRKDGETSARIPYFGGMWLPRMIAACSGTATTDDHEINDLVVELCKGLLG